MRRPRSPAPGPSGPARTSLYPYYRDIGVVSDARDHAARPLPGRAQPGRRAVLRRPADAVPLHLAPAADADALDLDRHPDPARGRRGAGQQDPPRGRRDVLLVRRRRHQQGRLPRGAQLRRDPPAADRLHLREQPVRHLGAARAPVAGPERGRARGRLRHPGRALRRHERPGDVHRRDAGPSSGRGPARGRHWSRRWSTGSGRTPATTTTRATAPARRSPPGKRASRSGGCARTCWRAACSTTPPTPRSRPTSARRSRRRWQLPKRPRAGPGRGLPRRPGRLRRPEPVRAATWRRRIGLAAERRGHPRHRDARMTAEAPPPPTPSSPQHGAPPLRGIPVSARGSGARVPVSIAMGRGTGVGPPRWLRAHPDLVAILLIALVAFDAPERVRVPGAGLRDQGQHRVRRAGPGAGGRRAVRAGAAADARLPDRNGRVGRPVRA